MKLLVRIGSIVVIAALVFIGGVGAWKWTKGGHATSKYQTAPVKRTDLLATISATGTVEPEEVIDVGAQVAGQIFAFGKDDKGNVIDYGSQVEEGTVLAQIDDSLYAADVGNAKALLQQAQASEIRANADLLQMKAKLDQAQRDWERAQKLGPSEALAPTTYDAYKATYETAKANVAVDEAAIEQAKASIAQAKATLARAQRNLEYCTIKSPVKGVIIDRRVNIGQTVVSSLNAPSLFLLAKDLTRMQVWVQVNEADIGNIHPGQPATFTVDAFPGQVFKGQVGKVRLNATMTQNVVTYTVIVNTDNKDGKLLPYLTANVQFETGSRQDVLAVPNAALRWLPTEKQIAPEFRNATGKDRRGGGRKPEGAHAQGTVWVEEGNYVKPIKVMTGLTDGSFTEVSGSDLSEGMVVITGEQLAQTAAGQGASPFTPQIGRGRQSANQGGSEGGARSGAGR
jgi:HlyD family secretion protein